MNNNKKILEIKTFNFGFFCQMMNSGCASKIIMLAFKNIFFKLSLFVF